MTTTEVRATWPWSAIGRTVWVDHTPMTGRIEGVQVGKSGRVSAFLIRMKGRWPGVIRRPQRDVSFKPDYDRKLYPGVWKTNPLLMRPGDYDALRKTVFGFLSTNTSIDPQRALTDSSWRWYIYRMAGPFPNQQQYWYLTQSMIDKALKSIIQEFIDTPQEEREKHVYPLIATLKHNRLVFSEYSIVFQLTFHQPLSRYWNSVFGFDIVKFDDEIARSGENESVADAVKAKYGEEALRLVEKLL